MTQGNDDKASWVDALLARIHLTLARIGSLGDSGIEEGELWVAELNPDGSPRTARRLGTATDLTWPVAGGERIFAIQGHRVVEISAGAPKPRGDADTYWYKLVGALPDGTVLGITVDSEGAPRLSALQPDGSTKVQSDGASDPGQMAILMQESRSYAGVRALVVDRPASGKGFDVFFSACGDKQNVSNCQGDICGQPSLSSDGTLILFIRQPRY